MRHQLIESITLRYESGEPINCFARWISQPLMEESLLLVDFPFYQYWLPEAESLALTAIYYSDGCGAIFVSVTDRALNYTETSPGRQYAAWAEQQQFARIKRGAALRLVPTYIPKPWGQEIWLTGVERRGVCKVEGLGGETPLPWLQAVMPGQDIGICGTPLILLKILDPSPEPVVGDLYFELHEEKREVYVVTHIDKEAWPEGTGYIRFGLDADKRALFQDDDSFREAYLTAVRSYEAVRRQLDKNQDEQLSPDAELAGRERYLRQQMDSFTHMHALAVGDVVKVPLLTPHALQHGVRTIEFQTPVYERKILSFAQKVLTQKHWDTTEAVAQMLLEQPQLETFETLRQEDGLQVERIVDFSDFEVQRVTLDNGQCLANLVIAQYALLMIVRGHLQLSGSVYGPEQALLLPRGWQDSPMPVQAAETLVFLLALPRDSAVES